MKQEKQLIYFKCVVIYRADETFKVESALRNRLEFDKNMEVKN